MDAVGDDASAGPDDGEGGLDGGDDNDEGEAEPGVRRVNGSCGSCGGRGREEGGQEEGDERAWKRGEI